MFTYTRLFLFILAKAWQTSVVLGIIQTFIFLTCVLGPALLVDILWLPVYICITLFGSDKK